MILADLISMIFRLAELVFGAIVLGITAHYLHITHNQSTWSQGRHIYTIVVASLSVLLSLIWLFPFSSSFIHWPADLIISIAWFVSFGLLVNWLNGTCGRVFDWSGVGFHNECGLWKSDIAFSFLSAICWLVSALLGLYWVHRHRRQPRDAAVAPAGSNGAYRRRAWFRRSRV